MYKLLKYYTDSCSSCKTLTSVLKNFEDKYPVDSINCEEVPEAYLSKTGVEGVPTVVLLWETDTERQELARFTGPKTTSELTSWLNDNAKGY